MSLRKPIVRLSALAFSIGAGMIGVSKVITAEPIVISQAQSCNLVEQQVAEEVSLFKALKDKFFANTAYSKQESEALGLVAYITGSDLNDLYMCNADIEAAKQRDQYYATAVDLLERASREVNEVEFLSAMPGLPPETFDKVNEVCSSPHVSDTIQGACDDLQELLISSAL